MRDEVKLSISASTISGFGRETLLSFMSWLKTENLKYRYVQVSWQ